MATDEIDRDAISISGVMIFCEDIREQTEFYRDIVGLNPDDPQPFPANRFFRFRSSNGAVLCLHSGTKPNGGRQKLVLESDDVMALIQRVKSFRRSTRIPKPEPNGSIVFDFRDPEGNRIQVYGQQ